ncbi:MAG: F0F1 ATP synthase subunit B [Gemmatimonadales bacterium]|nr:F0F1 ATP synthase subunit B [Gemmatimonadales bacterium]
MEMVIPKIPQLITQVIGFLIFVWILRKYAWGPILDMLDERRGKIDGDYQAAEKNLAESEELRGEFELKLTDIKVIEREKVQEAVKRGEEMAGGIVGKAREQAEDSRTKAEQDIEIETQKAQLGLRDSVVNLAIGAAEKVIGERMDNELHRKLIQEYIDNLPQPGESPNA